MTHRAVTQTAWATWTFYSTPIPVSVSWPASPAKRDRMHLTHLSASSQVVIRACQPQAARAFKKQMLQVHSSQFCCFFQHVSLFLIWATFTASHSSYLKFFSCLHFRSWNTLHFFKLLCMFMSYLFLP